MHSAYSADGQIDRQTPQRASKRSLKPASQHTMQPSNYIVIVIAETAVLAAAGRKKLVTVVVVRKL